MERRGLEFLPDEAARLLILRWLEAVVEHSDVHVNSFTVQNRGAPGHEYFLGQKGSASYVVQQVYLPNNIIPLLVSRGWAEGDQNAQRLGTWYCFTETAIAWYHANSGPTDDEVRSAIGRYFLQLDDEHGAEPHRLDADVIARNLRLDETRVRSQTRFLVRTGMLDDVGSGGARLPDFYQLSQEGYRWAARQFDSVGSATSPILNAMFDFTFHFNIQPSIVVLDSLDIPEEQKQEAREAAESLERDPTPEKLRKLLEVGADGVTIGAWVSSVIAANANSVQHLMHQIPGFS